ncbi:MAG: nickel-dependent lactate racemase [Lentisphaerae bacterium]|nr:nickel-dependent lactate racemase [Lentisphaerota bacterium]
MRPTFAAELTIPADQAECLGTLRAPAARGALTAEEIQHALAQPLWPRGGPTMFDCVQPGESVCLVVSDHTRRSATERVLPILLRGWLERRCRLQDFFILISSGIHRHPTPAEISGILGAEMAQAFAGRIWAHDPDDTANLVAVGRTPCGHVVSINRRATAADRLILLGAVSYHYHAGFGGGRKSLVPGLAARANIIFTHSLTLDPTLNRLHPQVEIGRLDGNPVAEEMLAGARLCQVDGIINTVLTPAGKLAGVWAGDLELAHRAACKQAEQLCRVDLARPADFVIASAGKASNWIQSHKALFNAARAVTATGRIILQAPCPEGLGDEHFRYWVTRPTLDAIFRGLRQNPDVLGQTALSTRMRGPRTILITDLNARDRRDLGLNTAPDIQAAVKRCLQDWRGSSQRRPTYYIMPEALSLVPFPCRPPAPPSL